MVNLRGSRGKNKAIAAVMSFLMVVLSVVQFAAGGGTAFATRYSPQPEVSPAYTGPLTWTNYTDPVTIGLPGLPGFPGTPGEYYAPYSLAVGSDDSVYVTKLQLNTDPLSSVGSSNGKVEKVSDDGKTVTDITYDAAFKFPVGIAVDKNGNVYVSDNSLPGGNGTVIIGTNTARILMLPNGSQSWVDITHGEVFKYAYGVAVDRHLNVYAVDSSYLGGSSRILKLSDGDMSWVNITGTQMDNGTSTTFSQPNDIAVDGVGNLFVNDLSQTGISNNGGRIFKLESGDTEWENIAPTGTVPNISFGLAVDRSDNLFSVSIINGTIKKLKYDEGSSDWTDISTVSGLLSFASTYDVAVDSSGYLYAANIFTGNISKLMAAVIYDGNGNTGGTVPVDANGYQPNVTATVYGNTGSLVKPGFTFNGWNTAADVTGATYAAGDTINMTQSVTLYAVWTPVPSFTVSYQAGAGGSITGAGSETVNSGASPAAVPTATPDPGYTFLGWSSDGGTTLLTGTQVAETTVTGNVTYTAYFQPPVTLTDITLDSAAYSLAVGGTHQTVATAVYSDQSTLVITSGVSYSSSNTGVAAVDSTGLVTAITSGQAVITAEYEGKQSEASVTVRSHKSGSSSSGSVPAGTTNPGVEVIVDGVKQDQLAIAQQDTVDGRTVTTVVLDSEKVIDKLEKENNKLLTIPVSGDSKVIVGELKGNLVKALESKNAQIQIVTDKATYTLPASQINIDSISAQVGTGVKLEDITIRIQIAETSDDKTEQVQAAAERNQFGILVHPVDFEISASYGTKTVQANSFNSYVGRMIALPEGTDANQITTGVVLTQNGELYHVPTVIVQQDGKTYALINSLTNSTYSVIYNHRELDDVKDHWAKADVNDMSSRLIIQGVTETEFRPDASITRAEFAAIVTRGLGIQSASYAGSFKDVGTNSWYAGTVQAAINYKLIDGYEDGTFRPDQNISRQEATAVLSRAMSIAKLQPALSDADVNRVLSSFTDGSGVAGWAQKNVASAISLNLVNGRGDKLDLEANLTRAETAALVRRFLQAANLINQ